MWVNDIEFRQITLFSWLGTEGNPHCLPLGGQQAPPCLEGTVLVCMCTSPFRLLVMLSDPEPSLSKEGGSVSQAFGLCVVSGNPRAPTGELSCLGPGLSPLVSASSGFHANCFLHFSVWALVSPIPPPTDFLESVLYRSTLPPLGSFGLGCGDC